MRAALLAESGKPIEIVHDIDVDRPGPGQVVVEVKHCGLCHSDLSIMTGQFPTPGPIVLGHEAAGVVAEVGPGVTRLAPGDRVLLTPTPSCGHCYFCVRDQASICVESAGIMTHTFRDGSTGLSRQGQPILRGLGVGGFGERTIVLESGAVKLPDDVDLGVAAVMGCSVQTGVGAALYNAKVTPGSTVLVMGLGGIGISIVQGARLAGASRIIVSDPVASRRDAAERFGATDAVDPTTTDVIGHCHGLTGVGVDYAFDAVGSARLIEAGYFAIRNGGTLCVVGAGPIDQIPQIPAPLLAVSQKTIVGSLLGGVNSHRDIPLFLDLYRAGKLDLEAMITSHRPIEELELAADDMKAGTGLRTILDF